jgi:hypothetical protein
MRRNENSIRFDRTRLELAIKSWNVFSNQVRAKLKDEGPCSQPFTSRHKSTHFRDWDLALCDMGKSVRITACNLWLDFVVWNLESQIQTFYQLHSRSFQKPVAVMILPIMPGSVEATEH